VTCGEARAVGRQLLLLDVMPGHGRDNLQHELELGAAQVCVASPRGVTASALALRDQSRVLALRASAARRLPRWQQAQRWEPAFVAALQRVGLELRPAVTEPVPPPASGTRNGQVTRGVAVT
jgi:processive 1,2-diacylglycerol beta-glucosyltransferase